MKGCKSCGCKGRGQKRRVVDQSWGEVAEVRWGATANGCVRSLWGEGEVMRKSKSYILVMAT